MEFLISRQADRPYIQIIARFILVFIIILLAAKFGQYILYGWNTSPAVLSPSIGIGVAIMWLYGYRYALPIFVGLMIGSLSGPTAHLLPYAIITPVAQIGGMMFGVHLLHRLRFEGVFTNIRNVLVFFASIILLALIIPLVTTTVSHFSGNITDSYFTTFSRRWAGYAFSCLILTPFLIAWALPDSSKQKNRIVETVFVGMLLTVATYLLFWTRLPSDFGFVAFALFFMAVIWVCLRFSSRIVTLSVVFITVFGILGLFLSPNPSRALNSQVFAAELFLFIVVPIMYAYSALVKDRQDYLDKLQHALSKIEIENQNTTNFIAVLAHELRNPLSPIKTTLEILKLQKLQPEIQQLVVSAYNQVHSMRRLLDDLLDVTRVTQGKFELKTENVHLSTFLQNTVMAAKSIVGEYNHTLVLEKKPSDSIMVHIDPVRFEQVLINVINNAAKFTDPGGRISLLCEVKDGCVEIRIRDNGKGIEADHLESIFRSFWQIQDSSRLSTNGIGVGLALARQIMELHHGSIHAESSGLGKGSTFVILIPYTTTPVVADKKKEEITTARTFKIAVIDDNVPAANALAHLLEIKGHVAHVAYSGEEAMAMVMEKVPEVVLLDIGLPDMSGYEVAEKLRTLGFKGSLVAITGYGQQEDRQKATAAGFDFHFTKPMAIGNLEAYLHTL